MMYSTGYNNGSILSYAEYGSKSGYPVIIQHGLIASIKDFHFFHSMIDAGLRLICIARPGYGESSPHVLENMAEWGDVVSDLVEGLGLPFFDLFGISSGAPYSYAIARSLPDRARNVFIFSGTPALFDRRVVSVWPHEIDRNATIPELQEKAKKLYFCNISRDARLQNDIIDSMKNDCFGIALDFKLRCNRWGFDLAEVRQNVFMQHGRNDNLVPFEAAEITSAMLPNCLLETRDTGHHFSNEILDEYIRNTVLRLCGV